MDVRDRLKQHIETTDGLSFANVAEAAGLSNSTVQKYCTGYTQSMSIENLDKVARAMNVSLKWLLFGDEDESIVSMFQRIPERKHAMARKMLEVLIEDEAAAG